MSSQGPEDQILADVFARIGPRSRVCVEIGARDGIRGSNTHRLRQAGWRGVLLDTHPQAKQVLRVHVTAENVTATLRRAGVPADFDLLSIDIDGNDFHVWQALEGLTPRVVIIEYNSTFGPDEALVIPYRPDRVWDRTNYYGASAAALVALGAAKGYTLVAVVPGVNLVFVRTDEGLPAVPVPPADPCRHRPVTREWLTYPAGGSRLAGGGPVLAPPAPARQAVRGPVARPSVPRLFPGGTVACLGSGKSLTAGDVALLRGRVDGVIVVNDAFRLAPWADVLYACDAKWWGWHWTKGAADFAGVKYALAPAAKKYPGVQILRDAGGSGLELRPDGVRTGRNSGYQAINVAVHLGATRILLLGYDMAGGHFFGHHPDQSAPPFAICLARFATLVEPLAAQGVAVINCTRRTALTVFPQVALETALGLAVEQAS